MSVWAFLDESGDPNLNVVAGSSSHFAICAVVVPDAEVHQRRAAVEGVRRTFFQTGPLKSQKVGQNLQRRVEILTALAAAGCCMAGLIVEKRLLDPQSGLGFRRSFMKFISRFLYDRLFRAFPTLQVCADRHGRPEFMASFNEYLNRHWQQTSLFGEAPAIEFVDSRTEVLVQAADFFAGSLRIAYESDETAAREILSCMRPMSLGIQDWPTVPRTLSTLSTESDTSGDDADRLVRSAAERSAYQFLKEHLDPQDDNVLMQIEVVRALLESLRCEESTYLHRESLAERLRELGFADCTPETVRRAIIAPLRDREVLIVSSARGYSLAAGAKDLETHLQRMEDEVRPIFRRIKTLCTRLKLASAGSINLLATDRFHYLDEMLDCHTTFEGYGSRESDGRSREEP